MATTALERRPATWEEYLAEDVRSEYIDGSIVMAPVPSRQHQNTVDHLMTILKAAVPENYGVIAGWGWKPGNDEFGPDLMVYPDTDEEIRFTGIPVPVRRGRLRQPRQRLRDEDREVRAGRS